MIKARVTVTLKNGVLDPQGEAIRHALGGLGHQDVTGVRQGKLIELYLAATNVFNHTNPLGYSGVQTSPFFGRPTSAAGARKMELGLRVGF